MDKGKVTVVVPIYNVQSYLNRCIESIVNQTYKSLEILLIDDGSPDNCPKMCDEWAEKDSRIKVIHKKTKVSEWQETRVSTMQQENTFASLTATILCIAG